MKKIFVLMVTLLLAMFGSLSVYAAGTTLVNDSGIEMYLLKFDMNDIPDNYSLDLHVRAVNNTDTKVWLDFKDATVDGVSVQSATRSVEAHTDTGEDDPLFYHIWPKSDDGGAGSEAIKNGKTLQVRVRAQDAETYTELFSKEISIDLTQKTTDSGNDSGSSTSDSSYSSGTDYAPLYTPASTDYTTLEKGSSGQSVKDLQQRLTDLGYLNDKIDGKFGRNTATAVMSFCSQHGLYVEGKATPEMQRILYSSSAQYYEEPYLPLVIGPEAKWDNPIYANLDNGTYYTQLVNRSPTRTIRGYELYYYKTDVWGDPVDEVDNYYMPTTGQMTIEPGYNVYSEPIVIYPFSRTYTVWVGVHKIVFDDGEVREVDDDEVQFFSCNIK